MFFKALKPLHGWRAFIGEVAIIVIGVGIALIAQQVVEDWNWREEVRQARQGLVGETADNFDYAAERLVVQPCLDAQADRLVARVAMSGDRLQPTPPIDSVFGPVALRQPSRPYRDDVWASMTSNGAASHLPDDEYSILSYAYTQLRDLRHDRDKSDDAIDQLNLFLQPIALEAQLRASLIERSLALKSNNHRMTLVAVQVMDQLWLLGLAPPARQVDDYIAKSGTYGYCRTMGLPLGDWRKKLATQRAEDLGDTPIMARYHADHHR